jgi:cold shock CspA family protein
MTLSTHFSAMKFVGEIKSMHEEKGRGFITCEEISEQYKRDAFLHWNQWEEAGRPAPGTKVIFRIEEVNGKPQARDVSVREASHIPDVVGRLESKGLIESKVSVEAAPRRVRGTVKSYSDDKGFGFIATEELGDVFIHRNQWNEAGCQGLCALEFGIDFVHGSPQARNVRIISELLSFRPPPGEPLTKVGSSEAELQARRGEPVHEDSPTDPEELQMECRSPAGGVRIDVRPNFASESVPQPNFSHPSSAPAPMPGTVFYVPYLMPVQLLSAPLSALRTSAASMHETNAVVVGC